MKRLCLATHNHGKLREFRALLEPLGYELLSMADLHLPDTEEPHPTFVENALTKARHASRLSGLPALADDSGLCVPALQGAPGVHSARYAGEPRSDERNNEKLLAALEHQERRRAYYTCHLALLASPDDPSPLLSQGIWNGEILRAARGSGGFGYDPLFFVPEYDCTVAELDAKLKNSVSHRGLALKDLLLKLATRGF